MKITNLSSEQAEKIFYYASPIATYVMALYGGLWWLSEQVIWSGVISLCALYVYGYEIGFKQFYKTSHYYFYLTFIVPSLLATILFGIGFLYV